MIRPLTLLSMVAAAGAGLYLYQVKHAVSQLDRELREINRQTEQARERTQVLTAEWALLNEPERLRQVAQRHLSLEPMAPAQFARLSDMRQRLPAARDFAAPASYLAAPATALAAAAPRADPPAIPDARAAPPATRTADAVQHAPRTADASQHAPRAAERALPEVAPAPRTTDVAAAPPAEPAAPPRRLAAAAPPRPARPPEAPVRRALHVQPAAAPPAPRRVAAAPSPSASILGGGISLAPPVPIASAAAATLPGGGR
jgi:hypothetical protein